MGITINEALNISSYDPFDKRMDKIIDALGLEEIRKCIPFSDQMLEIMYKRDTNFNEHMDEWDQAAGFFCVNSYVRMIGSPLMNLMKRKLNVSVFSVATNISILKETAKRYIESKERS